MARKFIDPIVHESWTRGRASYREKCQQELVPILQQFDSLITSVMIHGLPWAGSSPRNEKAVATIMAIRDGNMCCGTVNLSPHGWVVSKLDPTPTKFEEFVGLNSEKIWAIMTRIF
jgi:hypothetical protein